MALARIDLSNGIEITLDGGGSIHLPPEDFPVSSTAEEIEAELNAFFATDYEGYGLEASVPQAGFAADPESPDPLLISIAIPGVFVQYFTVRALAPLDITASEVGFV